MAPNVLFLMSDEHRADVSGFAGNTVVRTPNLDRLARDAVVFDNAYTPSPICVPARQSLMAGLFPRHSGCENFGSDLPPGSMTFARRFTEHGYNTVCCGKLHHQGVDQMQGWAQRPFGDMQLAPWAIDNRQDSFAELHKLPVGSKWSDSKECLKAGIGEGPYQHFDDNATLAACQTLDRHFIDPFYDRPVGEQPLLLKLSLLQPHYPYFTNEAGFRYYLNRVDPYLDEQVFDHPFLSQRQVPVAGDVKERDLRRATAAYYSMIEQVDTHIGAVLDKLEQCGQSLDDWIIIYTSDHGEMLGEHGIWEKQKFFEASVRVPLFIRWPKQYGARRVSENVNLCDLFATLVDLCGLSMPEGSFDSRSLRPLMQGQAEEWHSRWHNETVSQFAARNLMIKRDAIKYQYYGTDMPEVLFDLERDPHEGSNLITDPAYAELLPVFRERAASLGFGKS